MSTKCLRCWNNERTSDPGDILCDTCRGPMNIHLDIRKWDPEGSCISLLLNDVRCGQLHLESRSVSLRFLNLISSGCSSTGDKLTISYPPDTRIDEVIEDFKRRHPEVS